MDVVATISTYLQSMLLKDDHEIVELCCYRRSPSCCQSYYSAAEMPWLCVALSIQVVLYD
jgi:hypothetical protein